MGDGLQQEPLKRELLPKPPLFLEAGLLCDTGAVVALGSDAPVYILADLRELS